MHPACHHDHHDRGNRRRDHPCRRVRPHRGADPSREPDGYRSGRHRSCGRASCSARGGGHRGEDRPGPDPGEAHPCGERRDAGHPDPPERDGAHPGGDHRGGDRPGRSRSSACPAGVRTGCCRGAGHRAWPSAADRDGKPRHAGRPRRCGPCPAAMRTGCCPDAARTGPAWRHPAWVRQSGVRVRRSNAAWRTPRSRWAPGNRRSARVLPARRRVPLSPQGSGSPERTARASPRRTPAWSGSGRRAWGRTPPACGHPAKVPPARSCHDLRRAWTGSRSPRQRGRRNAASWQRAALPWRRRRERIRRVLEVWKLLPWT